MNNLYRSIKRFFVFMPVLLFLSSCMGISGSGNHIVIEHPVLTDFDVGTDYDRSDSHIAGRFTDTDNAVYFITGGSLDTTGGYAFLRYYDKVSGISGVLCGKPECTHEDSSCNAYLGIGPAAWGISAYGKKLYIILEQISGDDTGLFLYEMNPDGTGRREICRLEAAETTLPLSNTIVQFHRGYCLIGGTVTEIEDGIQYARQYVTAYRLDGKEKQQVYVSEKKAETVMQLKMQPVGDDLFILDAEMDASTRVPGHLNLMVWNFNSKEINNLYNGEVPFFPYEFWVSDNEILFSCTEPSHGEIYCYDTKQKSFRMKFNFTSDCEEERAISIIDGKLISYNYVSYYDKRRIEIRDFDGNLLFQKTDQEPLLDEKELPYIRCLLGADKDHFYCLFSDLSMLNAKAYPETLLKRIGYDGTEKVLWTTGGSR